MVLNGDYGASDTKNSNPTRCGMPINELLPQASSGTSISYRGGGSEMIYSQNISAMEWNTI